MYFLPQIQAKLKQDLLLCVSLLFNKLFSETAVWSPFINLQCTQISLFFRRQQWSFWSPGQSSQLESSYFVTRLGGLWWEDSMVSPWIPSRRAASGPSASPRDLRGVWAGLFMFPLQASNCTTRAWGQTLWRTLIQIRENHYLFFVVVMSWMYLKMCALLYNLCLTFSLLHFFFPLNRNTPPFSFIEFFNHLESRDHSVFSRAFSGSRNLCWVPSSCLFSCGEEDCPSHFTFVTSHS